MTHKEDLIVRQATSTIVKNLLQRSSRLAPALLEKLAHKELISEQKNGRLFTAKEL